MKCNGDRLNTYERGDNMAFEHDGVNIKKELEKRGAEVVLVEELSWLIVNRKYVYCYTNAKFFSLGDGLGRTVQDFYTLIENDK
ncbi:MAG: hypothetical protein K0S25_927 [Bacillus sp. (in: firmicutes)]|jgi:hypothetical protein|nr:hypothetical protein [Bacillus sp. (in: firmicutes)]